MKHILFVLLSTLSIFLFSCSDKSTGETTEDSSKEQTTDAAASKQSNGSPCSWVDAAFVKSTLEIDAELQSKSVSAEEGYGNISCDYEWEDDNGTYGTASIYYNEQNVYESAAKAATELQRIIDLLQKGIKAKTEVDSKTEEVIEGKNNNSDGEIEATFKLSFNRIDEEAGFPAAFQPEKPKSMLKTNKLMFVAGKKVVYIEISFSKSSKRAPEQVKQYAIAIAKKIRG